MFHKFSKTSNKYGTLNILAANWDSPPFTPPKKNPSHGQWQKEWEADLYLLWD